MNTGMIFLALALLVICIVGAVAYSVVLDRRASRLFRLITEAIQRRDQ